MSEVATAPAAEVSSPAPTPPEIQRDWTPSDAARLLASRRAEKKQQADAPAAIEAPPQPAQELAQEANAAPQTEATSETQEVAPAEVPPIDLPRSWTKEQAEHWNALPRNLQEYLSERASKDSEAVRRSQNEAAEIRKAAEAERRQAEEIRKQYEAKLPSLVEALRRQSEFADIKSLDDVKRMQAEDPFRFQAWQVYQMDAQAAEAERKQAEERQQQEKAQARASFAREQEAKLLELIPEMKDPEKANGIRSKAVSMLVNDYGFTESDLGAMMQTDDGFKLLSDARWQKLIADGLKYQDSLKAKATIAAKPLPPVQRPGVSAPAQNGNTARIQALEKELSNASGVNQARIMAQIRQLRSGAR